MYAIVGWPRNYDWVVPGGLQWVYHSVNSDYGLITMPTLGPPAATAWWAPAWRGPAWGRAWRGPGRGSTPAW
eukprot:9503957-Pyramimonas_sp.AAC.2